MSETKLFCAKCNLPLEPMQTEFEYMGHTFNHTFLRCPACREVFIPEEITKGRMADVEHELEDK